jgi:[acyl-carrier-protein] S-malonyltransferase
MGRIALVFPGQGSQVVGMGKALYEASAHARQVMDEVQLYTRPNLLDTCFNGPDAQLLQTQYTQPALLAVSLGVLAALKAEEPELMRHVVVTAGHSLGEYGSLVAANVLTVETAAKLVEARSRLMSEADAGAMAVVLGLGADAVRAVLAPLPGTVVVANDNSPEQVVISGEPDAVSAATAPLKAAGAKRVIPLAVSGAFHSPLMHEAADTFTGVIADYQQAFAEAHLPVITNVDAVSTLSGHAAKLASQIEQGVQWTRTMTCIVNDFGVDLVVELGSGKVLTGLFKKAHPDVATLNVSDRDGMADLHNWIQGQLNHV